MTMCWFYIVAIAQRANDSSLIIRFKLMKTVLTLKFLYHIFLIILVSVLYESLVADVLYPSAIQLGS